ncbi:D-alanine--D-alanine ligase [Clostridia bacterium]|nr:D-alanine--D-alanine ligase [Clostridia bacterium]
MKKIAVLMGGTSTESKISLKSGKAVAEALLSKGYDVLSLDTSETSWFTKLDSFGPDVVFIALHGKGGEDGTMQGYLETKGYVHTGTNVLGSAVAMNKITSQHILSKAGLPIPQYFVIDIEAYKKQGTQHSIQSLKEAIGYPMVVKAPSQGSSIGIYFVENDEELIQGLEAAFQLEDQLLVESLIEGMEITVSVVGNENPFPMNTLEITTTTGCYDYETKYTPGMSQHIIPARLPESVRLHCRQVSREAYKALGLRGFGRVDLMLDKDNNPYILEANTIPGMTETSLIPDAARYLGIDFVTLVELICEMALGNDFPEKYKDITKW